MFTFMPFMKSIAFGWNSYVNLILCFLSNIFSMYVEGMQVLDTGGWDRLSICKEEVMNRDS